MIHISRVTQPKQMADLLEHITVPEGTKELFAEQLLAIATQRPELLFVCRADSDQHGLVGFVVADLGPVVVNLRQAWVSPKTGWFVGTELNARLKLWAIAHGRTTIEIRTQRSAEALYRRFGFEETAKIMTQTIPEDFTQKVLESTREEVPNG